MKVEWQQIIEGWRNHIIPPKDLKGLIQDVYEERLKICEECPKFSENAKKEDYSTIRKDIHCTSCGCPLKAKLKSLSSKCPLDNWQPITSEEERFKIDNEIKQDETKKL